MSEVIKELLDFEGINVNTQDSEGNTPLHTAFMRRDYDCMTLLLSKGAWASIDIKNKEGLKPFEMLNIKHDVVKKRCYEKCSVFTLPDDNTAIEFEKLYRNQEIPLEDFNQSLDSNTDKFIRSAFRFSEGVKDLKKKRQLDKDAFEALFKESFEGNYVMPSFDKKALESFNDNLFDSFIKNFLEDVLKMFLNMLSIKYETKNDRLNYFLEAYIGVLASDVIKNSAPKPSFPS
jgi:pantothenate kinase